VDFERIGQLVARIRSYPPHEILLEMAILWVVVYLVFRFLRGTRGARVIKGVAVLLVMTTLVIKVLAGESAFERLNFLYSNFLTFASLALVVVFQPEIRRALTRLGEARFFRGEGLRKARVIDEVIESIGYLSKNKIGAIIAIERQVGLDGIIEAGTRLDSLVSKELLETIFWPGSALHDMGVVIQGDRIIAAGVQFPLADGEGFSSELGSRHRAAIGLSQECDALIIVVSEETGTISVAERGQLIRSLTLDRLRSHLTRGLGQVELAEPRAGEQSGPKETEQAA
jgi:diadenylate cyclase